MSLLLDDLGVSGNNGSLRSSENVNGLLDDSLNMGDMLDDGVVNLGDLLGDVNNSLSEDDDLRLDDSGLSGLSDDNRSQSLDGLVNNISLSGQFNDLGSQSADVSSQVDDLNSLGLRT